MVVLSHRGLAADRRLAERVGGIDVIVGGHSHTLLADGLPQAEGPHVVTVDGPDRPVRIVQAGAFGQWLGRLDLDLDADGRVLGHGGNCVPIAPDLPEDAPALRAGMSVVVEIDTGERRSLSGLFADIRRWLGL